MLRIGALLRNNLAPVNKQLSFPGGSEIKSLPAMCETQVEHGRGRGVWIPPEAAWLSD